MAKTMRIFFSKLKCWWKIQWTPAMFFNNWENEHINCKCSSNRHLLNGIPFPLSRAGTWIEKNGHITAYYSVTCLFPIIHRHLDISVLLGCFNQHRSLIYEECCQKQYTRSDFFYKDSIIKAFFLPKRKIDVGSNENRDTDKWHLWGSLRHYCVA